MLDNPHRLPRSVIPRRYDITIEPDLSSFTFRGSQIVEITVEEATDLLILNATELVIEEAFITNPAGERLSAVVSYDEPAERAHLSFTDRAPQGSYELHLSFTGTINDQLRGFYRSTFTDVDGVEQTIATTQFEATDARRAFPCWDEPDFKATFSVSLIVPSHLLAVSNGREIERHPLPDGRVKVVFAETMRMSTYLVAYVVGPLEATDAIDVDGVPLRIIAPKGKHDLTQFALEAGEFCLRYLVAYYSIPYPGDKIDFIAVPDFAFGAMENLGAITFRESSLLVDPAATNLAEQRRVVDVIAHELAHMWFGDLVTMGWWEGIWLNEAFASFMEMKTTDAIHPEWQRWMAFAVDGGAERSDALAVDSLSTTRPVEFPVDSPDEANEMFDALTYGKGAAVLRMIEQYLGEDVFRTGVERYLKAHAYGNTVTADLWAGLDSASGEPVGPLLDTWILQAGFPQIDVQLSGSTLTLRQRRFMLVPDASDHTLWQIPIQVKLSTDGALHLAKLVMTEPEITIELDAPPDWLVANAGGHGFYRVRYEPAMLQRLVSALADLDPLERFTILDDTFAFVTNGQLTSEDFFALAAAYVDEPSQPVWQMLIGHLGRLRHITDDSLLGGFSKQVMSLVGPAAGRMGFSPADGESDLDRLLRGQLIRAMGVIAEDRATIEKAADAAEAYISQPYGIDPDVGQAGLFVTAGQGKLAHFRQFVAAHDAATTPQREMLLLQALTEFDSKEAADELFDKILDGRIRNQDSSWVLMRMLSNRSHGIYVWEKIRDHWQKIMETVPALTVRYILAGLPALSHRGIADEIEAFLAENPIPGAAKTQAQSIERLHANVAMREREAPVLRGLLS